MVVLRMYSSQNLALLYQSTELLLTKILPNRGVTAEVDEPYLL